MIEFFDVPPDADEAFLEAWTAAAVDGATLHEALRDEVQPRFAALSNPGGPDAGALLLVSAPAGWDDLVAHWTGRQGFISARLDGDIGVVHWSSPLMYARAVREAGESPARARLYGTRRSTAPRP
jgi:hypothetical protein